MGQALSYEFVTKWIALFNNGRETFEDDPCSSRPITGLNKRKYSRRLFLRTAYYLNLSKIDSECTIDSKLYIEISLKALLREYRKLKIDFCVAPPKFFG